MPLITKELLEEKLTVWTLSSQVHKALGFTDEQEAAVKAELNTLAELGVVDRDGARRGLKYRLAGVPELELSLDEDSEDEASAEVEHNILTYKKTRDLMYKSTKDKTLYELLDWITNVSISQDPSLTSMTLAIKKLPDGSIVLRTYAAILKLDEVEFKTPEKFAKFIQKSITPNRPKESK